MVDAANLSKCKLSPQAVARRHFLRCVEGVKDVEDVRLGVDGPLHYASALPAPGGGLGCPSYGVAKAWSFEAGCSKVLATLSQVRARPHRRRRVRCAWRGLVKHDAKGVGARHRAAVGGSDRHAYSCPRQESLGCPCLPMLQAQNCRALSPTHGAPGVQECVHQPAPRIRRKPRNVLAASGLRWLNTCTSSACHTVRYSRRATVQECHSATYTRTASYGHRMRLVCGGERIPFLHSSVGVRRKRGRLGPSACHDFVPSAEKLGGALGLRF